MIVKNYKFKENVNINVNFNDDAFINVTQIAKDFSKIQGKRRDVSEFLSNKQTQEYINTLIELKNDQNGIFHFVIVKRGGNNAGTWLHPKLAILFARWLSADFAVWCDQQIDEILFCQKLQHIIDNNELSNYINNNKIQRSIYVFYSDNLNAYKIGVSRNVEERLDQIKNQLRSLGFNAIGTRIIFSQICEENQAFKLEKQIHQYYEMFRMNQSEWFNFDESQIESVINYIKSQLNFVAEKNNSGV